MGTLLSCARSRAGGTSQNPLGNPTVPSRFTGDRSRSTSETVTKSNDSNFRFSAASFDGCSQRAVEQRSILSLPAFRLPPFCVCAHAHIGCPRGLPRAFLGFVFICHPSGERRRFLDLRAPSLFLYLDSCPSPCNQRPWPSRCRGSPTLVSHAAPLCRAARRGN